MRTATLVVLLTFLTLSITVAYAESEPVVEWRQMFGGSGHEVGFTACETSDGNYIMIGATESYDAGNGDIWLVKADPNGNELWNKTFGGPAWECGRSIIETSDGNYLLAGGTESFVDEYDRDVWLIKTDPDGNVLWNKTFGGSGKDDSWSVQETNDCGYVIVGCTDSFSAHNRSIFDLNAVEYLDVLLIKTDQDGNEEWIRTFGGGSYDLGYSGQQTNDGGYIITGVTKSYGNGFGDFWLIKTDSNGYEEWNRTFGGANDEYSRSVRQTSDVGYIIVGDTGVRNNASYDVWLVKTDSNGYEEWNRTFGEPARTVDVPSFGSITTTGHDHGSSVQETQDGGYVIAGNTASYGSYIGDIWLIKTDSDGYEEWNVTSNIRGTDEAFSVQETSDGGYIVAGDTSRGDYGGMDFWLWKFGYEN